MKNHEIKNKSSLIYEWIVTMIIANFYIGFESSYDAGSC